jgi:hypothetical protein
VNDDDQRRIAESASQARRIQRDVNREIRQIERRQAAVPSADTVEDLQETVQDLRALIAKRDRQGQGFDRRMREISERLATAEQATQDLQEQVDTLEENP